MLKHRAPVVFGILIAILTATGVPVYAETAVKHVVLISFDGLRPDAVRQWSAGKLPHFYKMMAEGAYTLNARSDVDYTITLPNHTCMLTSRRASGPVGHGVTINTETDKTVHQLRGSQVDSIFDVLRAHGLTSAMAASKLKFKIYQDSYPIDHVQLTDQRDEDTLAFALKELQGDAPPAFTFIHFSNSDQTGHQYGWSVARKSKYMKAVVTLDGLLGQVMGAVKALNERGEATVVIVTADHGGTGLNHSDIKNWRNYTIPFWVWGARVAKGKDLYKINENARNDPGKKQIPYEKPKQPIRSGDAANLALHLLGLECVPQSTIGCFDALSVM